MLPRRKSKGGDCAAKRRRSKESKEPELPRPPSPDADDNEEPLFFIDTGANRDDADNGVAHDDDDGHDDEDKGAAIEPEEQPEAKKKGGTTTIAKRGKRSRSSAPEEPIEEEDEEKDEAEAALERMLFGASDVGSLFQGPLRDDDDEEEGQERIAPAWQDEDDEDVRVDITGKDRLRKLRQTPEEKEISGAGYQERLRARFQQSNQSALNWAVLPDEKDKGRRKRRRGGEEALESDEEGDEEKTYEDEDDLDLFKSSAPLVATSSSSSKRLQPGVLEIFRCRDANLQEPSKAVVQAVQFHPSTGGLLLTAGLDKTLRLFQVDGNKNEKAAGIFFPDLPIQSAAWVGQGYNEIIVSGRRPFFYCYDTITGAAHRVHRLMGCEEKSLERFTASPDGKWLAFTGKGGYIILVSAKTKQWAGELKMNGTVRALAFTPDSSELIASGGDAVVYRWDMRSSRCLSRFRNEGGTVTSSLAACGVGIVGCTAVGSESGVVNLYDNGDIMGLSGEGREMEADLKPMKAIMNLTTAVDTLAFNHDGQLLAMASKWNRDALRMVHVPSRTVFSNWPTGQTPIRYPSAVSFSPNSGFFAIGNDRGRVLLYRLRHYDAS